MISVRDCTHRDRLFASNKLCNKKSKLYEEIWAWRSKIKRNSNEKNELISNLSVSLTLSGDGLPTISAITGEGDCVSELDDTLDETDA